MRYNSAMCRNIKKLRIPDNPPTDEEITLAALQFVRKVADIKSHRASISRHLKRPLMRSPQRRGGCYLNWNQKETPKAMAYNGASPVMGGQEG